MPTITGGHHIALTVTDVERSAAWYADLFAMQVVMQGDEEEVQFRVLADPESGWLIGLRQYPGKHSGEFDELRTGLDHFAFGVSSRAELEAWAAELSRRQVPYSPVRETPIGAVIVFRDPDNIQLEFWLPADS